MIATKTGKPVRKPTAKVPDYLIYEIMDGQPIHYKGYRDVMNGTKTAEDIMGSSSLQSLIVTHLISLIYKKLNEDKFTILANKAGIHLNRRNNLAGDILIFDNETLPIEAINESYVSVPPKIVIEVDITADPADMSPDAYLFRKTQKLLNFGVERVIWITTQVKKVTVATQNEDWYIKDWHKDVEIMPGISVNIGQYLTKKGSIYA